MTPNIDRVVRAVLDSSLWACGNDENDTIAGYLIGIPGDASVGVSDIEVTPFFTTLAELDAYCAEHYAEIITKWGDEQEAQ